MKSSYEEIEELDEFEEMADVRQTHKRDNYLEMLHDPQGWDKFPDGLAEFIVDFFKYGLTGYEKLIFFKYYMDGWTLKQIGEATNQHLKYIQREIKGIEKKLAYRYKNRDTWHLVVKK